VNKAWILVFILDIPPSSNNIQQLNDFTCTILPKFREFLPNKGFLRHLKVYCSYLPRQTFLTLRGQALSGDADGAVRGLAHILKKDR